MQRSNRNLISRDRVVCGAGRKSSLFCLRGRVAQCLLTVLVVNTILFSGCGGGVTSNDPPQSSTMSGNWQFSMTNPDTSGQYPSDALYSLQGGFLLQSNGTVTGQAAYYIYGVSQSDGAWAVCDSGSATITGTSDSQGVTLTALTGSQTITLQGTLDSNGLTTHGTFTTAGGTAPGFVSCGQAASGLAWHASLVPSLTGAITGSFHSGGPRAPAAEANQDFLLSGSLTQGPNVGASSATVTGTLSFIDPVTNASVYPCVPGGLLSVNGQISGNTVILQLFGLDGSNSGQIGVVPTQANNNGDGTAPVTFTSTTNGYVLDSTGIGYVVNTASCSNSKGGQDSGYVCLGLNSSTACQQPITLSPSTLVFPAQRLGSTTPSSQTTTITNISHQELDSLTLTWNLSSGTNSDIGPTDFTNLPNFSEADDCVLGGEILPPGGTGSDFSLAAGQSCTVTISFTPQASCTWLPGPFGGSSPAQCPLTLTAQVVVNNVATTADNDPNFAVPIKGIGSSFVQPSTPELDFSAEAFGEASLPQLLSFTNNGPAPVQILPAATCPLPTLGGQVPLTHPLVYPPQPPTPEFPAVAAGLQVVAVLDQDVNQSTILYNCDFDTATSLPNFQISSDTCSGALLAPQQACSLQVTFVPQTLATYATALDHFLELNTVQCTDPVNDPPSQSNPCELDGGRFPVELRANISSPLRMSPAAGLDFGNVAVGKSSNSQTITLLNDPTLSPQVTVDFVGRIAVNGNYSESDDCPFSLAPGGSCSVVVTFVPKAKGRNSGTLTINYTVNNIAGVQTVYMRGTGQ